MSNEKGESVRKPSNGQRQSLQKRSGRMPGEKIDTMHVTWESQRMARDLPISTDPSRFLTEDPEGPPMIAGQLLIYDLDETPPNALEEEISKQQQLFKQDCAISRQGLMVVAMALGSLAFVLFIVILALFLKLKKRSKEGKYYNN